MNNKQNSFCDRGSKYLEISLKIEKFIRTRYLPLKVQIALEWPRSSLVKNGSLRVFFKMLGGDVNDPGEDNFSLELSSILTPRCLKTDGNNQSLNSINSRAVKGPQHPKKCIENYFCIWFVIWLIKFDVQKNFTKRCDDCLWTE